MFRILARAIKGVVEGRLKSGVEALTSVARRAEKKVALCTCAHKAGSVSHSRESEEERVGTYTDGTLEQRSCLLDGFKLVKVLSTASNKLFHDVNNGSGSTGAEASHQSPVRHTAQEFRQEALIITPSATYMHEKSVSGGHRDKGSIDRSIDSQGKQAARERERGKVKMNGGCPDERRRKAMRGPLERADEWKASKSRCNKPWETVQNAERKTRHRADANGRPSRSTDSF